MENIGKLFTVPYDGMWSGSPGFDSGISATHTANCGLPGGLLLGVSLWGAGEEESLEIMSTKKKKKLNTKYICIVCKCTKIPTFGGEGGITILILNIKRRIGNP